MTIMPVPQMSKAKTLQSLVLVMPAGNEKAVALLTKERLNVSSAISITNSVLMPRFLHLENESPLILKGISEA